MAIIGGGPFTVCPVTVRGGWDRILCWLDCHQWVVYEIVRHNWQREAACTVCGRIEVVPPLAELFSSRYDAWPGDR